ncbi:type 1 glutamine amidotransferase [Pseudomaricurvus alcaniphilus]|uniref:glutamine amidotransferase-related protein n=1 Tax=Pseudomaricurvus alcaniphilus TaxID=1166482 RepID=UPI001409F1FB|nr:type 1 glutamine amidotransferase [Pseudomaricurvus alcaniphilus]
MTLTIGILETGTPPAELINQYSGYGAMFVDLLGGADSSLNFIIYPVRENRFPDSIDACDGWLITGSKHGVYENLPWMLRLQEFLQQCQSAEKKVVGICFGHQILAAAMGGKVEKFAQGWSVGPQQYTIDDPAMLADFQATHFSLNAMHQDQVVVAPPGSRTIASSSFCRYAGLAYGNWAISLQAHPEFSDSYEKALVALRRRSVIPEALADAALEQLEGNDSVNEGERIAHWISRFFKYKAGAH